MSGVDNRIVTMQFNNSQFEQNAKTSLTTLQRLKESMNFGSIVGGTVRGLGAIEGALSRIGLKTPFAPLIRGANVGLMGIGTVMDRLGMRNPFASATTGAADLGSAAGQANQGMGVLEGGVTAVSGKFIALTTVAVTALSNITNKAIASGTAFAKSFTFAPVMAGLHEYETNLKSIQTVQANTDRPLDEINASLDELNKYSDQTIYNFSEMAKNVGTFTAAGVDLETSVSSIKGIANLAALSGSSSEQAAGAMYQLSQAIAAGKVGLMDWNSVVNAGMGGKKLQNALAQTAVAMGKINAEQVKGVESGEQLKIAGQSFRESIMAQPGQESWLSSDILVNTLASMDGRFSAAALAAEKTANGLQKYSEKQIQARIETARTNLEQKQGVKFTDEQFEALQKMSTMAFKSATEVKTLGQVFDVAKESIGSGWAASFRNIFGDLKEAKAFFTPMSQGLNDIIGQNALARNKILAIWNKKGGRAAAIDGLKATWESISKIIGSVSKGFRDIFPANTGKDLIEMSEAFSSFMANLVPGKATLKDIRDIAAGVFSVFSIGKTILGGVIDGIKALFDAAGAGNGDFLDFAASIGRMITDFDQWLKSSGVVTEFFTGLGGLLALPLSLLQGVARLLGAIFDGFNVGKAQAVADGIGDASDKLKGLTSVADGVKAFFDGLIGMFSGLGEAIGRALVNIGPMIASFLGSDSFDAVLDTINTGLFAALTAALVQFFRGGPSIDLTGGVFSNIAGTLEEATGALSALQTSLKADALLKIGIAIGVLAGALLILSTIDPGDLRKALTAMTLGFGVLIGALVALMKFMGPVGVIQIYAVSSALTKLALAILFMAFALKIMAGISFGDMLRGLVGLAGMLFIITKAMVPLGAGSKGMIRAAGALILLGIALNIMAVALKIFASMSWGDMVKGLVGLTGTLLALAIGLKAMPPLNAEAVTLIALGVAINILAIALKIFATMSWTEMAKGLLMLTGALGAIALAMRAMPKGMLLQSVALIAVAGALTVMAGALKIMGGMSWESIGKGLVVLGGAMLILAVGLNAMNGAVLGAAALVIAAGALAILTPVLATLGSMDVMTIVKALGALAGVFVVLGLAGLVLTPLIPSILGLSAALLLMGAGLALAGAGALAAATAFGIIVGVGAAGIAVLGKLLETVIAAIPEAMKAFGQGVVEFVKVITNHGPEFTKAMDTIISSMLKSAEKNIPRAGRVFSKMVDEILRILRDDMPRLILAGIDFLISFMRGLEKKMPELTKTAADLIVALLKGIAKQQPRIADQAFKTLIDFIRGLEKAIRENDDQLIDAGLDLADAIVDGIVNGLGEATDRIKYAAENAARGALQAAKDFLGINSPSRVFKDEVGRQIGAGMALGIDDSAKMAEDSTRRMGKTTLGVLQQTMSDLNNALELDTNMNPTVTPVLDLGQLTREANKMSSILATAPIIPTVSYQAAADISAITQPSSDDGNGPDDGPGGTGGGDTYVTYEHHLHSPTPLDSVSIWRDGKSLIALKKEELTR